jgi:hypothetical protein
MQRLTLFACAAAAMLTAQTLAASTPNTGPKPWDPAGPSADGPVPTVMIDHMKCVITEVRNDRIIQVWDEKTQSKHLVRLADDIQIEARHKKDFGGRKTIGFRDLQTGHRVKLTYRTADGTILGVKVIDRVEVPR